MKNGHYILRLIVVGMLLTFASGVINAQQWFKTGATNGGSIRCLTAKGDTIFAGAYGVIFRSTDAGNTWVNTNNGLVSSDIFSLAVNEGAVFAGTFGNGVYRTTDNGENWKAVGLPGVYVRSLAVHNHIIFAGTYDSGVYRSTDNGETWLTSGGGQRIYSIIEYGDVIFAGGSSFNRSTDEGVTWVQINKGTSGGTVCSLAGSNGQIFVGNSNGAIDRSITNGDNWIKVFTGPKYSYYMNTLAGQGNQVFVGTDHDGVFHSRNNGGTWTELNSGLTDKTVLSFLIVDKILYAGTLGSGIFKYDITTAVEEEPASDTMVFPNPVCGSFTVRCSQRATVRMRDTFGRMIAEEYSDGKAVQISSEGLIRGIYFVEILEYNGNRFTEKVMIQ